MDRLYLNRDTPDTILDHVIGILVAKRGRQCYALDASAGLSALPNPALINLSAAGPANRYWQILYGSAVQQRVS